MTADDVETRAAEPGWLSNLLHGRLGNVLLVVNLLFIARAEIIAYWSIEPWDGYVFPFGLRAFSLPLVCMLYHLVHLPAWLVVWVLGWLVEPFRSIVDITTRSDLTSAAFVVVASMQWLVVGFLFERWRASAPRPYWPDASFYIARPPLLTSPVPSVEIVVDTAPEPARRAAVVGL